MRFQHSTATFNFSNTRPDPKELEKLKATTIEMLWDRDLEARLGEGCKLLGDCLVQFGKGDTA